jgi:hypothetical protein
MFSLLKRGPVVANIGNRSFHYRITVEETRNNFSQNQALLNMSTTPDGWQMQYHIHDNLELSNTIQQTIIHH